MCHFNDVTFPFSRSFPKLCRALTRCLFLFIVYTLSGLGLSLKNTVHYFQSGSDSTELGAQPSVLQPLYLS